MREEEKGRRTDFTAEDGRGGGGGGVRAGRREWMMKRSAKTEIGEISEILRERE